jgi:UDP-N-acetylmuramyl pentapeptide phosphotransferase/UDP-N-acetylglucosamine-1-phosphate transferase
MVAGLMGALTAFCYFNLFGKTERNTRIFMGDSGSLSLGYILGFLAIKCAMDNPTIWPSREDAILVPLTLLFVPTADVVRVTFHRLFHHQPLFRADKNHIHHKLMQAGLSQHQALITILTLAVLFIVINSLLYYYTTPTLIVFIDVLTYCIFNVYINLKTKPASA